MRKLCFGLILFLAIVSLSNCTQVDKTINFKGDLVSKEPIISVKSEPQDFENNLEICKLCGCDSIKETTIEESFKSYTCSNCNNTKLQEGDCIFQGATNEDNDNKIELISGLETSTYENYKTLFFGKSDSLISRKNRNHLLARIFEPEFIWERFSHGGIKDNCKVYRDKEHGSGHFKLRYTYSLHGDQNCTRLLLHFVNKHSGSTLHKNLRPFIEVDGNDHSNSMMVFRHDDVRVGVDSFEKIHLHQEFNITSYDLPPKFVFSNEQQEWVPAGIQNPQAIINPKIIHDRLLLIFQLVNTQTSSTPICKLENIKVKVVIQCRSIAFPPNPKYSREFVENRLKKIHSKHNDKNFKLFLEKLEEKLVHVLSSIPNALLSSNNNELSPNTLLSTLSIPCKEALYFGDVPILMSIFNFTSKLSEHAKSSSYIMSTHIIEDNEENKLLNEIENTLNTN
ncbi:uncharacterized protein cubi_02559 [Cryptosporidium ubiquitum]|uniref:Uncharacterized protein n=1 Tax=Cryptosporidium ubiquitum TaxID=857276 RepID=A0A1J4MIQ5_9CRYT|nr:uncharacterized protein cubi_02559 [Cryptosporidium ubiquitum]OII73347.1 hypothetical protein cubi_02559 [Cryptosporidium ubiquitum]